MKQKSSVSMQPAPKDRAIKNSALVRSGERSASGNANGPAEPFRLVSARERDLGWRAKHEALDDDDDVKTRIASAADVLISCHVLEYQPRNPDIRDPARKFTERGVSSSGRVGPFDALVERIDEGPGKTLHGALFVRKNRGWIHRVDNRRDVRLKEKHTA
ncbi:hypothetical protein EV561_13023 [Rhizobium sp. BK376]|nr:hypothetical protein EV561_13023 [Rhizobium sp. BK376]